MPDRADTSAAARQRRRRARKAMGLRVYPVEIPNDIVQGLIERGDLDPDARHDDRAVAEALRELLEETI